jgi:hypothetical protein
MKKRYGNSVLRILYLTSDSWLFGFGKQAR